MTSIPDPEASMALRAAQLSLSGEPEEMVEEPPSNEIDIWAATLEPTDLSDFVTKDSEHSVSGGAFGDIYKGTWYPNTRKRSVMRMWRTLSQPQIDKPVPVAIKVVRSSLPQEEAKHHLAKEIAIWQRLKHDNILPFLGVSNNYGILPSPIAAWQENGTVETYLTRYPEANRVEILRGIANGLSFLHGHKPLIVHGDLKPNNILVSDWGAPFLSDFGISGVDHHNAFWQTRTGGEAKGTIYYMSPAQLRGDLKYSTTSSDVYAFAMTCYHIITGHRPFPQYDNEANIILNVGVKEERPSRPDDNDDITDDLWNLLERCWATRPAMRPPIRDAVLDLNRICATERPLRLLSIDGGGVSAMASLITLKAIMDEYGADAKPCDYFDMIAGSEVGGVIALMLGRLRMGIQACIAELEVALKELYDTNIDAQRKRVSAGSSRFMAAEFISVFGKLVSPRVDKGAKDMHDKIPGLCRTFVIAKQAEGDQSTNPRLRTYPTREDPVSHLRIRIAMGATMSYPLNFGPAREENASLSKYNNPDPQHFNPSAQLLDEARRVFGDHRYIGTFISLGNGLSKEAFNVDKEFTTGLPEALTTRLRHATIAKENIHSGMPQSLEPGTYYRFDPSSVVEHRIWDPNLWQELFAYEVIERKDKIMELTEEYVHQGGVQQSLKECAKNLACRRLEGPALKDGYQPTYVYPDA